jgi:hypothetical protein
MFATEFTYVNDTYRLVVDSSLAIQTAAWLDKQGVTYDRYFKHEGFCKFIFISAPDKAIALISTKYPLPTEPVVAIPDAESNSSTAKELHNSLYRFMVSYSSGKPRYWIECQSGEEAWDLILKMKRPPINLSCFIGLRVVGNAVSLVPDTEAPLSLIDKLINDLVDRLGFGAPVATSSDLLAPSQTYPDSYYFADCYTPASIKAKYRKLSKLHHPDLGGDSETFIAIAEQYEEAITSLS